MGGKARAEVAYARLHKIECLQARRAELDPIRILGCDSQYVIDHWWDAITSELEVFMVRIFLLQPMRQNWNGVQPGDQGTLQRFSGSSDLGS